MSEEKKKQFKPVNVMALPPLKMPLMQVNEERANKKKQQPAVNSQTQDAVVDEDALKKIIEHLEQKKSK